MRIETGATEATGKNSPLAARVLAQRPLEESQRVQTILRNLASSGHALRSRFLHQIDTHLAGLGKAFYPYQMEALKRFATIIPKPILKAPISGPFGGTRPRPNRNKVKSTLLVSPTGSGKTSIFAPEILLDVKEGKKVLVLTHRNFLSNQIAGRILGSCPERLKDELVNDKIQIIRGKEALDNADKNKPITIASVQTLGNYRDLLPNFFKQFDTIVIDEAHHYTADDYLQTLEAAINKIPLNKDLKIIGATATPLRHTPGVVPLSDIFPLENIVWTRTMLQLITDGKLKEPHGIRIDTNLGEDLRIDEDTQNVNQEDMRLLSLKPEFNKLLFDAYEEHSKGKNAIFFAHNKEAAELLLNEAISPDRKNKIPVAMILGDKTVFVDPQTGEKTEIEGVPAIDAREEVFKRFGKTIKVIINCQVLTEAVDLPQTQAIVYGSLTRSAPELQQIIGRGMRINPDHPQDTNFDFIYLDPETKKKFRFANLATLGLGQFEALRQTGLGGGGTGPVTIKPLCDNLALEGTVIEGDFLDKPDPEWEEILDEALLKAIDSDPHFMGLSSIKNPKIKLDNARFRLIELLSITATSQINLTDLVVGSDILFGTHGSTKIREAQRIFREMVGLLPALNPQEIRTRFPRLTGFETFEDLKKFMRSLQPQRPKNLYEFLKMTNDRFGIDAEYVENLYIQKINQEPQLPDKAQRLAQIFDDIWDDNSSWDAMYKRVCQYFAKNPKDQGMTLQKPLNALNKILETIDPKLEAKHIDLESLRNLQVFTYRNKLTDKEGYREFINTFIPRLECAIWLEKNKADLDKNNLSSDQINKLTSEPISMKKSSVKNIEQSEAKQEAMLNKASGLRKYGPLDKHESIVEHLKKLLNKRLVKNDIDALNLPSSLRTNDAINSLLGKIGTRYPGIKNSFPQISTALHEHLECMNSLIQYLKNLEANPDADQKLIKKIKKDLLSNS